VHEPANDSYWGNNEVNCEDTRHARKLQITYQYQGNTKTVQWKCDGKGKKPGVSYVTEFLPGYSIQTLEFTPPNGYRCKRSVVSYPGGEYPSKEKPGESDGKCIAFIPVVPNKTPERSADVTQGTHLWFDIERIPQQFPTPSPTTLPTHPPTPTNRPTILPPTLTLIPTRIPTLSPKISIPPNNFNKPAIPGDANGDDKVNGIDYTIWLKNNGKTLSGGPSVGDFDNNGRVDQNDRTILLNNFIF